MHSRRVPGLADLRVQPEVADQLAPIWEPVDVTNSRQEGHRDDQVHARDGHQPARVTPIERVAGDRLLHQRDFSIEEVDLAQPALEGLALLDGQLELGQPPPTLLAEKVTDVRVALQPPEQNRMDLVLCPRARLDQLRAP